MGQKATNSLWSGKNKKKKKKRGRNSDLAEEDWKREEEEAEAVAPKFKEMLHRYGVIEMRIVTWQPMNSRS